jgi:hypothetical protein
MAWSWWACPTKAADSPLKWRATAAGVAVRPAEERREEAGAAGEGSKAMRVPSRSSTKPATPVQVTSTPSASAPTRGKGSGAAGKGGVAAAP